MSSPAMTSPLMSGPSLSSLSMSSPAMSTPAKLSFNVQSRNVHPCELVRHCPVLQCPTPFFTGPSMSSPVISVNPVQGRHQPRSASTGCVELSRVRTSIVQRSFIFYGPTVWNSLPTALHDGRLSQNTFGRHLKSHLFEQP